MSFRVRATRVWAIEQAGDFERDIAPIFETKCLSCHNASDAEGEFALESRVSFIAGLGYSIGMGDVACGLVGTQCFLLFYTVSSIFHSGNLSSVFANGESTLFFSIMSAVDHNSTEHLVDKKFWVILVT